jgi:hypothetical protein
MKSPTPISAYAALMILAAVTISVPHGPGSSGAAFAQEADAPPPGVEQLLPRGGIPAVFDPVFVSADEAEIADDAWVLGVFANGEAHAYSLNLLNHHEIVNDYFGERPLAAVW